MSSVTLNHTGMRFRQSIYSLVFVVEQNQRRNIRTEAVTLHEARPVTTAVGGPSLMHDNARWLQAKPTGQWIVGSLKQSGKTCLF